MKKFFSLLLALTMLFSLCACGASSNFQNMKADSAAAPAAMPAYEMLEYASDEEGGLAAGGTAKAANGTAQTANGGEVNPDKIIYSADTTIETTEFDKTVSGLNELIEKYSGWVESSSVNGGSYYNKARGYSSSRSASYTVRIPCESFQTLMSALSTLGNIPYTHTYTQNVTAQYYDTQARLTAYKTQESKLLEMMKLAESVDDIIAIEDKLTDVRYNIESLQSTLNNWDRRVNYSTVTITVEEVSEYTPSAPVKVSYGQRLINAFVNSVKGAGEFFKDLLVLLVSLIPTIVILTVLFFVLRPAAKKLLPKMRERRAARKAAKAAKKSAAGNKENTD